MKEKERQILARVNEEIFSGSGDYLLELENIYSRFDAENSGYIAEIKYREKYYNETLIEFDKYAFNKLYAQINKKSFLYIVGTGETDKIDIYNISDLDNSGLWYKWHWRTMPKQTEFNDNQKIKKYVGYIDSELRVARINLNKV